MKKVLILIVVIIFVSCSKEDDPTSLPPATTTGANTVGCLVDGELIFPKSRNILSGPSLNILYQQNSSGYQFGLIFTKQSDENFKTVEVSANPQQLVQGNTYELVSMQNNGKNYISNFGSFQIYSNYGSTTYNTTNDIIGELTINRLDTNEKIISGTFWFDAIKGNGDIIEVREGRFDLHYVY